LRGDLLALVSEELVTHLLDQQLQVFNLLVAGTQLLALFDKLVTQCVELRFLTCGGLALPDQQSLQLFHPEPIERRQYGIGHEPSMPSGVVEKNTDSRMNTGDYYVPLYGHRRSEGALGTAPVDAFQKHRQLGARQRYGSARGLRPDEMPAF
jgi:hypothetical protein